MKEINLRDYYPFYTTDMIVEVPDEVADLLYEYKLSEAAHFLRTYRHKAYFSLDYDANVERDALVIVLTPADILERKEENAKLYQALASLPEKQRNRIYAHYFLGMSKSDIAKAEGIYQCRLAKSGKVFERTFLTDGNFAPENEMNNRGTYFRQDKPGGCGRVADAPAHSRRELS